MSKNVWISQAAQLKWIGNGNKLTKIETGAKASHTQFFAVFMENIHRLRMFYGYAKRDFSETMKHLQEIIRKLEGERIEPPPDEKVYEVEFSEEQLDTLKTIMKKVREDYGLLLPFMRNQILIFAVSLFEYYIKDLVEHVCLRNMDILKSQNKSITYDRLLSFENLNGLHKYLIEKESYSLGYMSYEEVSDYFLRKFKIDFSKSGIKEEDLVETFSIRNILIHNKGIVNRTFLEKVRNEKYKLGQKTDIDEGVLENSLTLIEKQVSYIDSCVIMKY